MTPEQHISHRVTSAMQFYATYMEHLAKSLNYSERADFIINNCKSGRTFFTIEMAKIIIIKSMISFHISDFFDDFNFKDVKSDCAIQSLVSLINSAILELNRIIEDRS